MTNYIIFLIFLAAVLMGYFGHIIFLYCRHRKCNVINEVLLSANAAKKRQLEMWENFYQEKKAIKASHETVLKQMQEQLDIKRHALDQREVELEAKEKELDQIEEELFFHKQQSDQESDVKNAIEKRLQQYKEQIRNRLLVQARVSIEEVRGKYFQEIRDILRLEGEIYTNHHLEFLQTSAEKLAIRILSTVIHKNSSNRYQELPIETNLCLSVPQKMAQHVDFIPLLGRQLGVMIEYDPINTTLNVNTHDGYTKEIAIRTIKALFEQDNLKPAKMLEVLRQIGKQLELEVEAAGQTAAQKVGILLTSELAKLIGRLQYRSSFGQNVLEHSIEVAQLAKLIASEIGLDPQIACRAGLLHDIGKAVDHEKEGGHPEIGGEILQSFGELPEIIQGVAQHHADMHRETPYATIISAADILSAARPGVRHEIFENYHKRLEHLEAIAQEIPGIETAFAISAGRELRVMVNPNEISDQQAVLLAKELVNRIEKKLNYPGKIKITVIREMKVEQYAN